MLAQGTNQHRPAARYEKPAKRLSISLGGQEADCTMSSYGRAGLIDGVVTLAPEALENALKLEVKLLITFLASLKFQRLRSLASPRLLDPRRDEVGHCRGRRHNSSNALPYYPAILLRHAKPLFRPVYRLPPRFDGENVRRPLPPTYEVNFTGVPGVRAVVRYSITVKFIRQKLWKWKERLAPLLTAPCHAY